VDDDPVARIDRAEDDGREPARSAMGDQDVLGGDGRAESARRSEAMRSRSRGSPALGA